VTRTSVTLKLETDTVAVGDVLKGRLLAPEAPGAPVTVELLWRTEGTCETEEKVVAAAEVTFADASQTPFELTVPAAGPMSYAGKLFTIRWFVRLHAQTVTETPLTVRAATRRKAAA